MFGSIGRDVATAQIYHSSHKSVSNNGSKRPKSQTWHRLAVWTVKALVAGIRTKTSDEAVTAQK